MPQFILPCIVRNFLAENGKAILFFCLAGSVLCYASAFHCAVTTEVGHPLKSFQESHDPLADEARKTTINKTPQELINDFPQLEGMEPATSQKDLPMILKKVGENVEAYFHNFVSTSAQEQVVQERLRQNGKVDESLKQKFQYLLIPPTEKKNLELEEYRTDKKGRPAQQKVLGGGAVTRGFASMPLFLHPDLQAESRFIYLGKQKVDGRDTWVVFFAQIPGVARFVEKLIEKPGSYVVFMEGLAWIDSANFQIIRLHTQLLHDLTVRSLQKQTTDITFAEVHFEGVPMVFWLPPGSSGLFQVGGQEPTQRSQLLEL